MRNIFILLILISGLIFTSLIKNKTRLLEKKLVKLNNEINILNFNLAEATLDFEYLSTPKNISYLAINFLDEDFSPYKKNQINQSLEQIYIQTKFEKLKNYNEPKKIDLKQTIKKNFYTKQNTPIKRLLVVRKKREYGSKRRDKKKN